MPSSVGRTPLLLALLLAAAAVAFLVFGNPFGPKADSTDGVRPGDEAPAIARGDGQDKPKDAAQDGDPRLATGFDAVGKGDVTVRLLSYRDRKPVAGQAVRMVSQKGDRVEQSTGEDGHVRFLGVRALRDWTLTIEGQGFATVEMKGVAVKARGLTDLGELLLGEKVVLVGRVIDTRGQPLPGTAVSAYVGGTLDLSQGFALALVGSALAFPTPTDEAKTDEKGQFTLASLTPGAAYELQAKHPGNALSVQSSIVVAPERATAVLTIVLGPGATLKGKVVDEHGAPVANALVIALEDAGNRFSMTIKKDYAKTRADGTYVLDTLTRGARYRFGVQAPGYAPVFDGMGSGTTIDLEATRDFTLAKGGTIEGLVSDKATGQPVADARVVAIVGNVQMGPRAGGRGPRGTVSGSPDTSPSADETAATQIATTGRDGRFRLEGLKPGPVALAQVKAVGYADYMATKFPGAGGTPWGDVRAGETTTQDVQLESGGTVTGKVMGVTSAGSVPLVGAQVAVVSMLSMFTGYPTAVTGEDGSYRIDGVKTGSQFTVTASASGFVSPNVLDPTAAVSMPESGGIVTKDLTLTAAGAVEGVVVNSKGAPVSGARVRTKAAPQGGRGGFSPSMFRQLLPGGGGGVVLSDGEGRFRIESVPSDERFVVEADTDEYVPGESDVVQVRAGESKDVKVVLEGGARLKGRVIDDRGAVVAGARLRVGHLDAENEANASLSGWRADSLLDARVIASDAEGWFEIDKIRSGRTLLKVEKDGYTTFYRRDLLMKPDDVRDDYVVTLTHGETISGAIKGDDGKPVAGAFVAVTKQENPVRGFGGGGQPAGAQPASDDGTVESSMGDRTDDQGRFTVENVPPGSYTVVVWFAQGYRGYGQGTEETAIKRGVSTGTKDVEFTLKKQTESPPMPFPMGPRPTAPAGTGRPGMGRGVAPGMGG